MKQVTEFTPAFYFHIQSLISKGTYHRACEGMELRLYGSGTLTPDCHEHSKEDSGSVVKKVGDLGTL